MKGKKGSSAALRAATQAAAAERAELKKMIAKVERERDEALASLAAEKSAHARTRVRARTAVTHAVSPELVAANATITDLTKDLGYVRGRLAAVLKDQDRMLRRLGAWCRANGIPPEHVAQIMASGHASPAAVRELAPRSLDQFGVMKADDALDMKVDISLNLQSIMLNNGKGSDGEETPR